MTLPGREKRGHFIEAAIKIVLLYPSHPSENGRMYVASKSIKLYDDKLLFKINDLRQNLWRRGWDSNPRYLAVRLISSQVHSATLPPLQCGKRILTAVDCLLSGGGQQLDTAHIRLQRLGHGDGAVGQLVVLQHGHQGAAYGQA
jgi:hypothetical protein